MHFCEILSIFEHKFVLDPVQAWMENFNFAKQPKAVQVEGNNMVYE